MNAPRGTLTDRKETEYKREFVKLKLRRREREKRQGLGRVSKIGVGIIRPGT